MLFSIQIALIFYQTRQTVSLGFLDVSENRKIPSEQPFMEWIVRSFANRSFPIPILHLHCSYAPVASRPHARRHCMRQLPPVLRPVLPGRALCINGSTVKMGKVSLPERRRRNACSAASRGKIQTMIPTWPSLGFPCHRVVQNKYSLGFVNARLKCCEKVLFGHKQNNMEEVIVRTLYNCF